MTDKATLLALAERVEKAEGADRELDALVWCALNGKTYKSHNQAYGSNETQIEFTEPPKRKRQVTGPYGVKHAPQWTASLDTAMTLVPDGWNFANLSQSDKGGWWCELRRGHHTSYDATAFGGQLENHSAAIAVCAAAIRAHASKKGD